MYTISRRPIVPDSLNLLTRLTEQSRTAKITDVLQDSRPGLSFGPTRGRLHTFMYSLVCILYICLHQRLASNLKNSLLCPFGLVILAGTLVEVAYNLLHQEIAINDRVVGLLGLTCTFVFRLAVLDPECRGQGLNDRVEVWLVEERDAEGYSSTRLNSIFKEYTHETLRRNRDKSATNSGSKRAITHR